MRWTAETGNILEGNTFSIVTKLQDPASCFLWGEAEVSPGVPKEDHELFNLSRTLSPSQKTESVSVWWVCRVSLYSLSLWYMWISRRQQVRQTPSPNLPWSLTIKFHHPGIARLMMTQLDKMETFIEPATRTCSYFLLSCILVIYAAVWPVHPSPQSHLWGRSHFVPLPF